MPFDAPVTTATLLVSLLMCPFFHFDNDLTDEGSGKRIQLTARFFRAGLNRPEGCHAARPGRRTYGAVSKRVDDVLPTDSLVAGNRAEDRVEGAYTEGLM